MFINSMILASFLSIDSFGVGITYGIKKTKIPIPAKIILFFIALGISSISLMIGNFIASFLPNFLVTWLGVILLVLMGGWIIFQNVSKKNVSSPNTPPPYPKIYQFFIRSFGITIQIIRDPISSDFDNSNKIDKKEAIYLGLAMSLDSLCSGIGISTFGVNSFLFPIFAASFQLLFLSLGNTLGKKIHTLLSVSSNTCSILSGILLILIGIIRLFL